MINLIVQGNIGQNCKISYLQDGKKVINFNIASTYSYNGKTTWFSCSYFVGAEDKISKYLLKGTWVIVTASKIRQNIYENANGMQSSINITADKIELLCSLKNVKRKVWKELKELLPEELIIAIENHLLEGKRIEAITKDNLKEENKEKNKEEDDLPF